ncbi:beta-galactosidase [bacterium]|nr:beta-galactosidase [bacterium]
MRRLLLAVIALFLVCPAVAAVEPGLKSADQIKVGLDVIEKSLPSIKADLCKLEDGGQDISYPMVSYTVLSNFIGYAREDVDKNEVRRASYALTDMEWMKRKLESEISGALSGKCKLPAVPRWTGDARPVIKGSSFIAPTTTPGKAGREMRPIFFNGFGHFSEVCESVGKWTGYGTNIIQFETGPTVVFPQENKLGDPTPGILKILDEAEKARVAVNFLLSPHYFPDWMFAKYPELRKQREYFFPMCLHAPETKELLKRYVKLVVEPIKDHPALQAICISNEPRNVEEPCQYANEQFHAWLKDRHGDIATLNSRWGTSYTTFDEITVPNPFAGAEAEKPMCRWADFVRWNQDFFTAFHKMLADAVHEVAPNMPVNAKVQSATFGCASELKCGNDAYLYGTITDINGNDSNCYYSFGGGDDGYANEWLENGIYYDLQRSVKDAPVENSENHLIRDRETRYVPPEHIRTALWQEAVHGQSATTIWVWERTFDQKSDLYGSIMQRPGCARAVGIANLDLNRAAYEVTALQQAPPQVLILHDTSALIYDKEEFDRCMFRTYIALNFTGLKIGFVTERQLEAGIVPTTSVLCIPNARHISNAAFDALKKYKGHIIMLGDESLAYDEFDKPRSEKLSGDVIPFTRAGTGSKELKAALVSKMSAWNVVPNTKVVDESGNTVWGVESREAKTSNGTVVNLCNYLTTPVTVTLIHNGKPACSTEVLSGKPVSAQITLQPLEVRLLRVK